MGQKEYRRDLLTKSHFDNGGKTLNRKAVFLSTKKESEVSRLDKKITFGFVLLSKEIVSTLLLSSIVEQSDSVSWIQPSFLGSAVDVVLVTAKGGTRGGR